MKYALVLVRKQITACYVAPHHYGTAAAMTCGALLMGEVRLSVIGFFWLYALSENIAQEIGHAQKK